MPEIPDALVDHVKHYEGYRTVPYICPAGYPTVGYGHRIPSLQHPNVTEEEATALLLADLGEAQRKALLIVPGLSGMRLAALTDLIYNVGSGPALRDSGTVRALRDEDWPLAAKKFRTWDKARDPNNGQLKPLPGLTARREVGAQWIEQG